MGTIIGDGITFDDVLLVPAYSEVIPNPVSYTHLDVYKRQHLILIKKNYRKDLRSYPVVSLLSA